MKLNCSALIRTAIAAGLALSLSPYPATAQAQTESQPPPEAVVRDRTAEATEKIASAEQALDRVVKGNAALMPADLVDRAVAIAVFDNVVQAAFLVGGRGGDGVVSRKTAAGWSAPAFFRLGGASVGAQIGGGRTDVVMLFMTEKAVERLLDNRLEFGAGVTAVAADAQAEALAADQRSFKDDVLVYSRERGLFAGVALKGAVITPNNDLNRSVYGAPAHDLLSDRKPARMPEAARTFPDALRRHLPKTE
jgi:SH3 domain-containing YSC84-like protein 1